MTEANVTSSSESLLPNNTLDLRDELLAQVEIATLAVIFVLALVGNLFSVFVLVQLRKSRPYSHMYLLMLHLSIADILVAIFNIFSQLMWKITFRFQGPDFLCKIIKYLQVFVLYLSNYLLMTMAIDRHHSLCQSLWHLKSINFVKKMIISAYVASALLSIPQLAIFGIRDVPPGDSKDCWVDFKTATESRAYVTSFVTIVFIAPAVVITGCYIKICINLKLYYRQQRQGIIFAGRDRDSGNTKDEARCISETPLKSCGRINRTFPMELRLTRANLRNVKMTAVVVICFVISWLPYSVATLYLTFGHVNPENNAGAIETVCMLLASLNSCMNPWVYLAFSGNLQNITSFRNRVFGPFKGLRMNRRSTRCSRAMSSLRESSNTVVTQVSPFKRDGRRQSCHMTVL
ncbi:OXTR (predicted) [Pycnogonum litorale]